MCCNSIANQGSIYHWVRDHRVHHKCSETKGDPHDATRGFFYAHVGWLLVKKDPAVFENGALLNFDDLKADDIVMFQKKCDPWINLFFCFLLPGLIPMMWGESFMNGFLVAGALRYVWVLHMTWNVNSVAHLWGSRPYDANINPAENIWVAIGAIGEGWHNWHHKYPYDYATSEHGVFAQFNPTKFIIDAMCFFGMAWDRKRALGAWNRQKAMMLQKQLDELNGVKDK
jgi:stearoyl-CoA desaturase (delta-9 desaturase)